MKKVIIKILAKDIRTTNYFFSNACAMTRAFERAGLPFQEVGGAIHLNRNPFIITTFVMDTPKDLATKVKSMYKYLKPSAWSFPGKDSELIPMEPQDFEYELEIPAKFVDL